MGRAWRIGISLLLSAIKSALNFLHHLSENSIKQSMLRFLKTYYKFRPRIGGTNASYDMQTADGIIADGHVSFHLEDGNRFLATFEATSSETIGEVKYRLQYDLLLWDSLAFSSIFTAFLASFAHAYGYFTLNQIGWIASLTLLLATLFLIALLYFITVRNFSRYHYIYAIEQFKKYHADEQWIALAEDAFANLGNSYLDELKNQCVVNGFGLVLVDPAGEPHLHITPSRVQVFKKKRRQLQFFNRFAVSSPLQGIEKMGKYWKKLTNVFARYDTTSLKRYQKSFFKQILVSFLGLSLIGGIYYLQYQDRAIVYVDEAKYEKQLAEKMKTATPEPEEIIVDTPDVLPIQKNAKPYLEVSKNEDLEEQQNDGLSDTGLPGETLPDFISDLAGEKMTYDCTRFYNFKGTIYLVQYDLFNSYEAAEKSREALERQGLDMNVIWLGCFSSTNQSYVVYYDMMYPDVKEAEQKLQEFRLLLRRKKIKQGNSLIRQLFRKN